MNGGGELWDLPGNQECRGRWDLGIMGPLRVQRMPGDHWDEIVLEIWGVAGMLGVGIGCSSIPRMPGALGDNG